MKRMQLSFTLTLIFAGMGMATPCFASPGAHLARPVAEIHLWGGFPIPGYSVTQVTIYQNGTIVSVKSRPGAPPVVARFASLVPTHMSKLRNWIESISTGLETPAPPPPFPCPPDAERKEYVVYNSMGRRLVIARTGCVNESVPDPAAPRVGAVLNGFQGIEDTFLR